MTEWKIQGQEMVNCNCNFGCPCQFSVLPTDGVCEAATIISIESGHYGDVNLDGLSAAGVYKWPGPIHEGNGQMQLIIGEQANAAQRAAIQAIMTGEDTNEMATMWYVYSMMSPNKLETLYKPITFDMNASDRVGTAQVPGVFEITLKPIPNIVSGDPHQVRINLPNGFEFGQAEMASGRTTTSGAISITGNHDTHAHFAPLHLTGTGLVRDAA